MAAQASQTPVYADRAIQLNQYADDQVRSAIFENTGGNVVYLSLRPQASGPFGTVDPFTLDQAVRVPIGQRVTLPLPDQQQGTAWFALAAPERSSHLYIVTGA